MRSSSKNQTHLSSLMGTWTWYSKLRIATYHIEAYLVMYMTPDPLRQFQCELDKCSEWEGKFCQLNATNDWQPQCNDMTTTVSHYGDALVYYHLSFSIDGNFPIKEHGVLGTGGWIGPFNVIWAQNPPPATNRYTMRYVETTTSPLLARRLPDDNLFAKTSTFYQDSYGEPALKETIRRQTQLKPGQDPYKGQTKTCDYGQLKPLLPMMSFDFTGVNKTKIEWEMDYKLLVASATTRLPLAHFLPLFAHEIDEMTSLGVTLEGPYCWDGDKDRVWLLGSSLNSSTIHETTISHAHGCVQGFPCRPELLLGNNDGDGRHPIDPDDCPQVDFNNQLFWKATTTVLLLLWACTMIPICCGGCGKFSHRRQPQSSSTRPAATSSSDGTTDNDVSSDHAAVAAAATATTPEEASNLQEPLLPSHQDGTAATVSSKSTATTATPTTNDAESVDNQLVRRQESV